MPTAPVRVSLIMTYSSDTIFKASDFAYVRVFSLRIVRFHPTFAEREHPHRCGFELAFLNEPAQFVMHAAGAGNI